ncbi:MAG: hypothetical protein ACKVJG_01305 [Candidatus Latescibacterota bacterium]|jgi:hypothetical protein|tara:strand:- start:231 stop:704 length:474 start_codon:yes stop_codon:yes gene_type:complete
MRYIRAFKYLLVIMAAGAALAFFEHQRENEYGHLSERTHARAQPALKGESLQELAQVLLELYPEGAQSNLLMGTALAEKGELTAARVHLEKALAADRHNQQLLFLYARLLLDMDEDTKKIQVVVDELRRLFPRTRQTVEEYFSRASRGELKFDEGVY